MIPTITPAPPAMASRAAAAARRVGPPRMGMTCAPRPLGHRPLRRALGALA